MPAKITQPSSLLSQSSNTTLHDKDFFDNTAVHPNKYNWVHRVLGIFCGKTSDEKMLPTEHDDSASPWLVPVYVLSTRQDKDKHRVPIEAKCTIDTGNMQGNIVSRRFVEDVLAYPKTSFCALTKEEEAGAIGITGHHLIPEAAIYLTWYHKKSARVFRDMRFLISPSEHFDLVIGAVSIQRDKLLDVPNLMTDKISIEDDETESAEYIYQDRVGNLDGKIEEIRLLKEKAKEKGKKDKAEEAKANTLSSLQSQLTDLVEELEKKGEEIMNIVDRKKPNAAMKALVDRIKQQQEELILRGPPPEYKDSSAGESTAANASGSEKK